jgi:polysaccharide export outer membrane protein
VDRKTLARGTTRALLGALALAMATSGCSYFWQGDPPPPDPGPVAEGEYVIGVADVLRIDVWKSPDLTVSVPVRPDGKISMPLVDNVQADGLTTAELKELLTRELAEYVANPDVTVTVLQINSKRVNVIGEVGRSGQVSLQTRLRVIDAITQSGGFNPFADKKRIRVIRNGPNGDAAEYRFDYDAFVAGNAPGTNILLEPGDTIVVPD